MEMTGMEIADEDEAAIERERWRSVTSNLFERGNSDDDDEDEDDDISTVFENLSLPLSSTLHPLFLAWTNQVIIRSSLDHKVETFLASFAPPSAQPSPLAPPLTPPHTRSVKADDDGDDDEDDDDDDDKKDSVDDENDDGEDNDDVDAEYDMMVIMNMIMMMMMMMIMMIMNLIKMVRMMLKRIMIMTMNITMSMIMKMIKMYFIASGFRDYLLKSIGVFIPAAGLLQFEAFLRRDLILSGPSTPSSSRSPSAVNGFVVPEGPSQGSPYLGFLWPSANMPQPFPSSLSMMVFNGSNPDLTLRSSFEIMFGQKILSIRLRLLFWRASSLSSRDFVTFLHSAPYKKILRILQRKIRILV
ncbi:hypothetical protein ElyMa_004131400 [Elysia marginata]|uniref:Uncharacterized protein n=1 Tax=Elysia marginata TaxID=1093978 RepID=A0AAV4GGE7_9GAST|nr:hypothetical protein ElyMa_004131400 [Elysia marginata]